MKRSLLFGLIVVSACSGPAASTRDGSIDVPDASPTHEGDADTNDDAGAGVEDGGVARGLARYSLEAPFPEGGAYDPVDEAFYVGSLGDGGVRRVDRATGEETVFFTETAPGTWWTLGMHVDAARRRLLVCAMDDQRATTDEEPPYLGYVWELDLATAERVAVHDLSAAHPRASCADVTTTSDGVAYVTDREHPNVYRIADGAVELFATDDALAGGLVGANAIVPTADEGALLAIVYLPSRLVRIDLETREVEDVEIDGGFLDATPLLSGADGMAWLPDGRLLVAFTSAVTTLVPITADWRAAQASSVEVMEGMTDVVVADGVPYLLNGQAVRFAFDREPDPFALVRFELR